MKFIHIPTTVTLLALATGGAFATPATVTAKSMGTVAHTVRKVGDGVTKVAVGDIVGVGRMISSCQNCDPCKAGNEQYCAGPKSCTLTYNGTKIPDGTNTYGGYSTGIIVREEFVLKIPDAIDPGEAAPILCAGATTYSAMKHWNLKKGQTLGAAGIGGLGHMAVQLGKALGAKVVAFTTSPEKADSVGSVGADQVIDMLDKGAVQAAAKSLDLLINTIPYPHDIQPYLSLMKPCSTLAMVGNMMKVPSFSPADRVANRIQFAGSLISGIDTTQEVLDLWAKHGIRPIIEKIAIDDINNAFKRMKNEDVRYRHVIDMKSLNDCTDDLKDSATQVDAPVRGEVVGRNPHDGGHYKGLARIHDFGDDNVLKLDCVPGSTGCRS